MDDDVLVIRPPKFRQPLWCLKKKQICVENLNYEKHTIHCNRYDQIGHYKSTCKPKMTNSIEQL